MPIPIIENAYHRIGPKCSLPKVLRRTVKSNCHLVRWDLILVQDDYRNETVSGKPAAKFVCIVVLLILEEFIFSSWNFDVAHDFQSKISLAYMWLDELVFLEFTQGTNFSYDCVCVVFARINIFLFKTLSSVISKLVANTAIYIEEKKNTKKIINKHLIILSNSL